MKRIDRCAFPHDGRPNWCLAIAWAHAAGFTSMAQVDELGRRAGTVSIRVGPKHFGRLFKPSTGFGFGQESYVQYWCDLLGKSFRNFERYVGGSRPYGGVAPNPTLAQFARSHRVGTFIVAYYTHGRRSKHALCVKDGVVYGRRIQSRKRLCESFEVLDLTPSP